MTRRPTERTMLDALWGRLCQPTAGGPPRSVLAEHVRYRPGQGVSIADAISIDTWQSGGYALTGYEVKVSRSDYLRELRDPTKAETWSQHCRYWWIVVPDNTVTRDQPPPHGWGLLTLKGRWLRQTHPAVRRPNPLPLPPSATAGLLRATAQTARYHALTPAERLLLTHAPYDHQPHTCAIHGPPCGGAATRHTPAST